MNRLYFATASVLLAVTASAQNHWWVSPTGNDADPGTEAAPFQTINFAATAASSGDVIHLFAETYGDEQGSIVLGSKDLSILGAGVGQTVINAHSSLDTMLPAGLLATPTVEVHRCCVVLQGSAETYIRDLTLDQGFNMPSSGRGYCLWVGTGADAVCDNVECINARANPISGIQGPLGVNIRGDDAGDACNVTMRGCSVSEYGKGGIVANFHAHLVLDDCQVDGFGHAFLGLAAQNGIQVSRGASAEIRRSKLTNHWYDPAGTIATGILLYDCTDIVIEDCSLGNNQVGIFSFGTAPATVPGIIRRNTVTVADVGLWLYDSVDGYTIEENSFSEYLVEGEAVFDDVGGNSYDNNYYSDVTTPGAYVIPGAGGDTDANARPYSRGFGSGAATVLPGGYAPIDMVLADLGGSGAPDFAALCQSGTPALAVGLNTGGAFTVTGLPFGNAMGDPVAIVSGEFDGVPGLDLAVVTVSVPPAITENKVYVFANDGSGSFSLLHTHVLVGATSPSDIAAGDVDGDNVDDLVVSDAGSAGLIPGAATLLVNDGSGTMFASSALAAGYTVACRGAAVGDLDGDTFLDIAIIEGDAATGRVHLFQGDGAGNFAALTGTPLTCSLNPSDIEIADVEGDGDNDMLVSAYTDAFGLAVGALDRLRNDGGSFDREWHATDRGPSAIATGDFDDDADPDTQRLDAAVVSLTGGSVSVIGNWSQFGPGFGGLVATGTTALGVGIGDVDEDGFGDLVYCDAAAGTVVVLPGVATARADSYGAGTTGTGGLLANLYPVGAPAVPSLGNATFGLGLRNVRPFSVAIIAAGLNPAPVVPAGLLILDIGTTWAVVTNVQGRSAVPLPIPASMSIVGFEAYCQAGVFDPAGDEFLLPGFVVTNGLKIRVGN